jgi:hypothetical protein
MKYVILGNNSVSTYLHSKLNNENNKLFNMFDKDIHQTYNIIFCCNFIDKNIDKEILCKLQQHLLLFRNTKIILFSSTLIYNQNIIDQNEDDYDNLSIDSYGITCFIMEQWIALNFKDYHIIRLPLIFGINIIEKNILYDLFNKTNINNINPYDIYNWYCIDDLLLDIKYIIIRDLKIANLLSESITVFSIISYCFDYSITKEFLNYFPVNTKKIRYNSKYVVLKSNLHILNKMIDFFKS